MGSTEFGNFHNFCRDSTLPVCNLFSANNDQFGYGGCELTGIQLSDNRGVLGNLGSILLCAIAIVVAAYLIWRSERKQAAVGRREMQLFLLGYLILRYVRSSRLENFLWIPRSAWAFTGIHLGMITATTWVLMLNAIVGYQMIDDGTPISLGLIVGSAAAFFVGTGYIALDTGYSWTTTFTSSLSDPNRNIGLYVLYQLAPLLFLVVYYISEAVLVLRVLGERKPMITLTLAALLFAIGQIFNYVVSPHICSGTSGKIDGALFETLFTLLSVVTIWYFWSSITEDDWPLPVSTSYP